MLSREELQREAAASGFPIESFEKATVLLDLLTEIRAHPFIGNRLALKGGTALNLFVLDVPRLSVDIDVNYVGAAGREEMLAERPLVDRAFEQVCGRMGLSVKRVPTEHAGGKWRLGYKSALGRPGTIEADMNFLLRTPLWPTAGRNSRRIGGQSASDILLVDEHELAAGKLAALMARSASRDLFDARELLRRPGIDRDRLRLGFVVYGGANREDWRGVTIEQVHATPADVDSQLAPMLRADIRPARQDLAAWTDALVQETRALVSAVLPLRENELAFLERLNGSGEIQPDLLTSDASMQAIITEHPGLRWKALNVKRHAGGADEGSPA